jgi:hypothetical protein
MNFRTESFDFPQNEQRRCLSLDIVAIVGGVTIEGRHWTAPALEFRWKLTARKPPRQVLASSGTAA